LVTTGPYAYLANPMQVGAVALLLLTALVTGSVAVVGLAGLAVAFAAAVAGPHEDHDLDRRYGTRWRSRRRRVRAWWPRWRPYLPGRPAVLWLDDGCRPCAGVRRFLDRRGPVALVVAPAGEHPAGVQWRAGYTGGDGHAERGVAAVARALEHVHLGWAWVGWLLRVPGITWLAQLVTDAMIAPPHPVPWRGERCPTPSSVSSTAR
jgi:hypothetical protein